MGRVEVVFVAGSYGQPFCPVPVGTSEMGFFDDVSVMAIGDGCSRCRVGSAFRATSDHEHGDFVGVCRCYDGVCLATGFVVARIFLVWRIC